MYRARIAHKITNFKFIQMFFDYMIASKSNADNISSQWALHSILTHIQSRICQTQKKRTNGTREKSAFYE